VIRTLTRHFTRAAFRPWGIVAVFMFTLIITACGGGAATSTSAPAATTAATAPPAAAATVTKAPVATTVPAAAAPTTGTVATTGSVASAAAPATQPASSSAASGSTQTKLTGALVPLVIYAAHDASQPMSDAFTKATGVPVKLVQDSTGPLLAKIQAEANNPQWHLLWADGAEAAASLDQQGLLLKGYAPAVPLTALGTSVQPQDKSYIPTGLTIAGTIVYDASKVPTPPTSWQDLLKPEWKGLVGMNNPAVSGPTYPFVAGMMQYLGGEDQGKRGSSGRCSGDRSRSCCFSPRSVSSCSPSRPRSSRRAPRG